MDELTDKQIQDWKDRIDAMSQYEMCSLHRFAPVGHPVFRNDLPLSDYFKAKFKKLGGFTPGISKALG